jgi:hypothetical protein
MMNYLKTAAFWDIVDDVVGAVFLFAFIPVFFYSIAFMKVIFE